MHKIIGRKTLFRNVKKKHIESKYRNIHFKPDTQICHYLVLLRNLFVISFTVKLRITVKSFFSFQSQRDMKSVNIQTLKNTFSSILKEKLMLLHYIIYYIPINTID